MSDHSQKTEQPTQRRLDQARREGRFPVSRELIAAAQFVIFFWLLTSKAPEALPALRGLMRQMLAQAFHSDPSAAAVYAAAAAIAQPIVIPLVYWGAVLVVAALALHMVSTQFGVSASKLAPDFNRLNPSDRLSQLPGQNLSQLAQASVALPLFAYLVAEVAGSRAAVLIRLWAVELESSVAWFAATLEEVVWQIAGLFLLLGFVDYYRQRQRWSSSLKMSKQEIRDEMKETEGNPQMKMRIRRLMRERSRRRMMKDVETATAVVVNPTHFAVALRYQPGEMEAPKVVAKGKNFLAARIRERAREHQVPIIENPPLAQALYKSAQVGQQIPAHLFRAVAEVLAYVFRLMNRLPG